MRKVYIDLDDYFRRSGKTRSEKAEAWRVTEATISRWISGSRRPRWEQAITVSKDTGIPIHTLMGRKAVA